MRQLTGANWHDLMVWSIGTTKFSGYGLRVLFMGRYSLTPKPDLFKPLKKLFSQSLLSFKPGMLYSTCSSGKFCSSSKGKARRRDIQAYSDLPKKAFGMRANSAIREPEIQKLWDENQMFKRVSDRNNGGSFIFHDGPPYTNSDLHMGHALNKILKDTTNRYKLLRNYKFRDVPGWDCHGQPIELKGKEKLAYRAHRFSSWDHDARKELTPLKLRAKAAKFAKATIKTHMASFKHRFLTVHFSTSLPSTPALSTLSSSCCANENIIAEVDKELENQCQTQQTTGAPRDTDEDAKQGELIRNVKPHAEKWKCTPIGNYEKLVEIYGKDRATGVVRNRTVPMPTTLFTVLLAIRIMLPLTLRSCLHHEVAMNGNLKSSGWE
ncbi:hypothetical protein HYC85_005898 [Camellia sinensis]|uniref:Aminoacyl-tRNA synthetase class Ia domain-containing protein n=1 Tax=Camellia sinensis TaxID=4442 RepID=A0A7J7I0T1_CAMSI|nr:hypothetical protein HYC85_005898 [Camellia sinensis]